MGSSVFIYVIVPGGDSAPHPTSIHTACRGEACLARGFKTYTISHQTLPAGSFSTIDFPLRQQIQFIGILINRDKIKMEEKGYIWAPSPHTADLAISITANSQAGLFMAAMEGLLGTLEIPESFPEPHQMQDYGLTAKTDSIENALVDFLNECICLMEVEELIPHLILVVEYSRGSLKAAIQCRRVTPKDRMFIGHIKAATYSDLEVTEVDGIYYARIIFDT